MDELKPTYLPASTMLEVLVALVIVVMSLSMGLVVYLNVMNAANTPKELRARLLVNEWAEESKINQLFLDDAQESEGGLVLQKRLIPYENSEQLYLMSVLALDAKNNVIYERKDLVLAYE